MSDPAWLRRMGHGPRTALMIHCSLAHSGEWRGVAEHLGDRLSITAYDLPGHGRAPAHDPARDIGDEATATGHALLAEAPGPVDLVGHSFGGAIALRLAVEAPAKLRSLTLIEPTLFAAARAAGAPEAAGHEDEMRPLEAALEAGEAERAAQLFTAEWGAGQPWEAVPEQQCAYITARIGLILASEGVLWHDTGRVLDRLHRIRCPVLLMQGAESPPIIGAIVRALSARLPDTRHVAVPGARHMLPVTHAGQVAAALGAFLSERG